MPGAARAAIDDYEATTESGQINCGCESRGTSADYEAIQRCVGDAGLRGFLLHPCLIALLHWSCCRVCKPGWRWPYTYARPARAWGRYVPTRLRKHSSSPDVLRCYKHLADAAARAGIL